MFRIFFVSTLMVSTSFTAFAMNSGNLPPQGGDQQSNKGKTIVSLGGVRKVVLTDDMRKKPLRSSSGLGTLVMERRLPHVKSSPDLLNEEVDFSKAHSKAGSESGEKTVQTRSLSFSSSSSSSSSNSLSSSSSTSSSGSSSSSSSNSLSSYSSNNLPQVFLASHATCGLATTSTSSSALAEEDSVTHATSSTEKSLTTSVLATTSTSSSALAEEESVSHATSSSVEPLDFKGAIKTLPRHLRTKEFRSTYKELDDEFQSVELIQSLSAFSKKSADDVLSFLRGLNALPDNIHVEDVVALVNTMGSTCTDESVLCDCLNKAVDCMTDHDVTLKNLDDLVKTVHSSFANHKMLQGHYLNDSLDCLKNGNEYASVISFVQAMGMLPQNILSAPKTREMWKNQLKAIFKPDMTQEVCSRVLISLNNNKGDDLLNAIAYIGYSQSNSQATNSSKTK